MKIALCLFGYPRGSSTYAGDAYKLKFEHLRDQVMVHNPDVFIHSWDTELEEEILDIFNPVESIFQEQISFEKEKAKLDLSRFSGSRQDIFKTLSFFYTRFKSNELKIKHEKENNFKYDCVVTSRFDVGYHNHGLNKTSYIKFNKDYDMNYVYSAWWRQINAGPSDHWFYGNSKNIDTVCNIYEHVIGYLKKDSDYVNTMMNGWFDSNSSEEFSNEFLKDVKSNNLVKYPEHYCLNNHCLYKWHLNVNNLWNKDTCKFLNKERWT
jgi:hypothetical protein